jgi:hypothetical protein
LDRLPLLERLERDLRNRTTARRPQSKPGRAAGATVALGRAGTVPHMAFHWRFTPSDATPSDPPAPSSFPSQSDAESWLGESWRELSAAGVDSVTLVDGQDTLYQMPLAAE